MVLIIYVLCLNKTSHFFNKCNCKHKLFSPIRGGAYPVSVFVGESLPDIENLMLVFVKV